ncbi:MAG TPA: toll-Interleukin receptor, partial [Thermoanaerobaculia bacterium]|nr:toll-Interleukin receptor [Thermoanaerobaculia bacterium]
AARPYDIFLSHSIRDAELVLGAKGALEDLRFSVYVDWIDDPQLDRSQVTARTAEQLRQRMRASRSLFFLTTTNASTSKWMPWECGYFDGQKEKVAIMPAPTASHDDSFVGQEYLGLYPYVLRANDAKHVPTLWVHTAKNRYVRFDQWVSKPGKDLEWQEA